MAHAHFSAPSGAPDLVPQPDRDALFWAVGAVIALLTAVAFWLSYDHLHTVASGHGLAGMDIRSWAWPSCLDAFVVSGELLMLRASLQRAGVDWWAVSLTLAGSGGSIALNIAGVGTSASVLDYVVAGVPPTAALLAFGALMRQLHQALTGTALQAPVPPAVPGSIERMAELPLGVSELQVLEPFVWHPIRPPLPAGTAFQQANPPSAVPASHTGTRGVTVAVPPPADTVFAERVAQARKWLAADPELTGVEIGTRLGTGDSYGRRVRRAALAP